MSDSSCVVCYRNVKYYSVGLCEHPVCFECSVRMRVLLEQNECPICRQILDKVLFTKGKKQFKNVKDKIRMFIMIPRYGIYVEDEDIHRDYESLLEHRCSKCHDVFKDFKELRMHVQKNHELYSCDLCANYIKQFPKERRFYTRGDLAYHKRKGDRDDKSHRGHPLCQFCDRRYFDQDELFKHLRKDHYFCHFCDADGYNFYYDTYDDLRIHFRKEHFLCEEEDCKEEKFTSVFRTEIDLKAHLTTNHSKLLGKHGTKQARVIDLEFNYGPRSDDERRSRRFNDGQRSGPRMRERDRDREDRDIGGEVDDSVFRRETPAPPKVNTESVQDFPNLEGAAPTTVLPVAVNGGIAQRLALKSGLNVSTTSAVPAGRPNWNAKVSGASKLDEEFPALGGGASSSSATYTFTSTNNVRTSSQPHNPQPKPFINATKKSDNHAPKFKQHMNPRPNGFVEEEFPSLGNPNDRGANGSSWAGRTVKMKPVPRLKKVAPAPLAGRKVEVDTSDDFHFVSLSESRARRDSLSEKFEVDDGESSAANKDKSKKKKKNRDGKDDTSNNMQINAASIFTGGNVGYVEPGALRNTEEDFPALQVLRSSLPTGPGGRRLY